MDVVKAPDHRLRVKTKPAKKIDNGLLNTTKEMVKLTKTFKDPEGVGLASTQIGLNEAFFVAKDDKKFISVFNPKIISTSKKTKTYFEGCLSIPNNYGTVKRHLSIKVKYQDETGTEVVKNLRGVLAWIFQHEIDHLHGILFPDRVLEQKGKFYRWTGRDEEGQDIFEEIKL